MIPSISRIGVFCISSRSLNVPTCFRRRCTPGTCPPPLQQERHLRTHREAGAAATSQCGSSQLIEEVPRGSSRAPCAATRSRRPLVNLNRLAGPGSSMSAGTAGSVERSRRSSASPGARPVSGNSRVLVAFGSARPGVAEGAGESLLLGQHRAPGADVVDQLRHVGERRRSERGTRRRRTPSAQCGRRRGAATSAR